MPLAILYQDDNYIAVNKPADMLVHRSPIDRHEQAFVMRLLRDQINQKVYPIHRLDKPTSGALIFGLSGQAVSEFQHQATVSPPEKNYLALTRGHVHKAQTIDHPLKTIEDKLDPTTHNPTLQEAVTHLSPLATTEIDAPIDKYPTSRYSLVALTLETGRRHQIRRHLKHISHPIIGDVNYGKGTHNRYFRDQLNIHGLLLHAHQLCFTHPSTHARIEIQAPLDERMQRAVELFPGFHSDIIV